MQATPGMNGFHVQKEDVSSKGAMMVMESKGQNLPPLKPEDIQYFDKLLTDVDEDLLSPEESQEREILKLLLEIKNGTPPMRESALRQITDKAREFGAGPLFNQILPLLMSPTLEDQERHLLVKVIDRVLYKLGDLDLPARAVAVIASSALYTRSLLPILKAVCKSKKSWQARHTGIKIVQQIAILMGCAILPHLRSLVEIIEHGLVDEQQKVRTITALALAALAEAITPYGIESFDSVFEPSWKGIRMHRGKGLAAFLKAIGYLIPFMDAEYAEQQFLRDELKHDDRTLSDKNTKFHGNDGQILVDDLWTSWIKSEVYNWTVEEVLDWLGTSVELPQYKKAFSINEINGSVLPRLVSDPSFLQRTLKIKNPIHRQHITIKAMAVAFFGLSNRSKFKEKLILDISFTVGMTLSIYSCYVLKGSEVHVSSMMGMETWQTKLARWRALNEDQKRAAVQRFDIFSGKSKLVERFMNGMEKLESNSMKSSTASKRDLSSSCTNISDVSRIAELENELRGTREQLAKANKIWTPPHQLQLWLQLSHELEVKNYNIKKAAAEHALLAAKDGCEKLRKKQQTFIGSFCVAHGSTLDEVDDRIVAAKEALSDVKKDLHERLTRWRQIEKLAGFDIVNNPGLESLLSSSSSLSFSISSNDVVLGSGCFSTARPATND